MRTSKKNANRNHAALLCRAALLCAGLAAAATLGGCATMGINTRTLESKPVVQAYEKLGSEAEETRSQAEGCPSCVY